MKLGFYRFSPSWWGILLVTVLLALMAALGNWQIQRGQAKIAMIAEMDRATQSAPTPLAEAHDISALRRLRGQRVSASGAFEGPMLLHDNQVQDQVAGFHVWSLLRTTARQRLLVNRGWIAPGASRSELPSVATPSGRVELTGIWRALPEPGMRLGEPTCERAAGVVVVQYPRISDVECLVGGDVLDGIILLDPGHSAGFSRRWRQVGLSPEKHFGYAFQWFALCVALLVLFVLASLRRDASESSAKDAQ